jgi:hypothetical protein
VEDEEGNREDLGYPVAFCNDMPAQVYGEDGDALERNCRAGQMVYEEVADLASAAYPTVITGAKCKIPGVVGSCATADDIGTCHYDAQTQKLFVCEATTVYDSTSTQFYLYPIALNYDYWSRNDSRFPAYDPYFSGFEASDLQDPSDCQEIFNQTGVCPEGSEIYSTSVVGDNMQLAYYTSKIEQDDSGDVIVPLQLCVRYGTNTCLGVNAFQSAMDQVTDQYPLDPNRWTVSITVDDDGEISHTAYTRTNEVIGYGVVSDTNDEIKIDYDATINCNHENQVECNYTTAGIDPNPEALFNQKFGRPAYQSDDQLCKNGQILPHFVGHFNLWANDDNNEHFSQVVPACSYGWVPVIDDSQQASELKWQARPCNKNNQNNLEVPILAADYSPGQNAFGANDTDGFPVFDTGVVAGDCNADNENACVFDEKYIYKCLAVSKHNTLASRNPVVVPFN